ncbi:hypothetical protein [Kribbella sp. NPDC051718]|uniref:hypothetical protein n=1 Tax=Kribbella sp. NPDC051718 TaxID=3155168 RepID=UPI003418B7E8
MLTLVHLVVSLGMLVIVPPGLSLVNAQGSTTVRCPSPWRASTSRRSRAAERSTRVLLILSAATLMVTMRRLEEWDEARRPA